ncbi:MAG TPA: FAD-binding oxidoreductase [Steroidobacteraceae bacterium]|nr:FAD-binding oxidoreductase [Steroidobacteraceae bacterium]
MSHTDIVVIGAGIAGASVAAHLAETQRVILTEREDRPGYHSTGRSAALFTEIYGSAPIRALTRASRAFLFAPPPSFSESALTRPRGCLYIATDGQLESLREFAALPDIAPATRAISTADARNLCPVLRADYLAGALLEPDSSDIDVHALHHGYLRLFKSRNGRVLNNAPVHALERAGGGWTVRAGAETLTARIIVNAAGAWADEIAALAGIARIGLVPFRRTAVLIDPPPGMTVNSWPFVNDIDEQFYFKPEGGSLFLSPADETPAEPCDAQPEEWDVATAVDRVQSATTLQIDRLKARWAGLRTFAADRRPVVGFSHEAEGFFWLAGQGGYGIQTAPALSRAAAALALRLPLPADLLQAGVRADEMSPSRFARGAARSP